MFSLEISHRCQRRGLRSGGSSAFISSTLPFRPARLNEIDRDLTTATASVVTGAINTRRKPIPESSFGTEDGYEGDLISKGARPAEEGSLARRAERKENEKNIVGISGRKEGLTDLKTLAPLLRLLPPAGVRATLLRRLRRPGIRTRFASDTKANVRLSLDDDICRTSNIARAQSSLRCKHERWEFHGVAIRDSSGEESLVSSKASTTDTLPGTVSSATTVQSESSARQEEGQVGEGPAKYRSVAAVSIVTVGKDMSREAAIGARIKFDHGKRSGWREKHVSPLSTSAVVFLHHEVPLHGGKIPEKNVVYGSWVCDSPAPCAGQ